MISSKRLLQYLGLVIVFGLLPMLAMAAPLTENQPPDKIDAQLIDQVAINGQADFWIGMVVSADLSAAYEMDWQARGWYVYETLVETAQQSQADLVSVLDAQGIEYQAFWINNSIHVRGGDMRIIEDLAARPDVARIMVDGVVLLPDPPPQIEGVQGDYDSWGLDAIHAPDVWDMGIEGRGIVVANVDTGVQFDHPQLVNTYRGTISGTHQYNWCDPSDICEGDEPCDNNGHGTHVMGTISGENNHPTTNSNKIVVAPKSTWMACKGCENNYCSDFALTECAQWLLAPTEAVSGRCSEGNAPDPNKRPHIVNNSWGDAGGDDWFQSSVQAWRAAGIFPAFSAGNKNICGSIGTPGDYQESFASANHMEGGTIHPTFSSRGPSFFGSSPFCKPNITAPGSSICSAVPPPNPDYPEQSIYTCGYTGTSMASPHSAGAVALVWQACPDLVGKLEATFQVLQNTAGTPPPDPSCSGLSGCGDVGCNCTYGYGYLDALAAVQGCLTSDLGYLEGHVYVQGTLTPVDGANVTLFSSVQEGGSIQASTDPSGYFTMTLLPGTYTVRASKNCYTSESVTGVEIVSDTVTVQDFQLEYLGCWTEVGVPDPSPMDFNRFDGVFDPHDNLVYFMGGRTGGLSHDPSIWTYDPVHDVWADTGCDLNHNASNITVAYVEDDGTGRGESLYVVGGYDVDVSVNIDAVQRYYPSEPGCVIEDVTSDPFPGEVLGRIVGSGGVAVVDDKIYYFGGWQTSVPPYFSDVTWEFDPKAPSGSRWTEIPGAILNPGRSYINVAVQNDLIYAMGGVSAYAPIPSLTLVPTDVVEYYDPATPEAGWTELASLPAASAEGRGFGFDADTASVQQPAGKIYVAGGGLWPSPSRTVLEYDVVGDTWNPDFSDLNTGRRDHAGSYVSVCTPDPTDGMPGMWIFGGKVSKDTDDPPYGLPEYFAFSCVAPELPQAALTAEAVGGDSAGGEPVVGCAPLAVQFTDVSSGTILERQWTFGDQTVEATGWRPLHTYGAGVFTPTLAVSNTTGSDLVTATVIVSATPSAAFIYTPSRIVSDTLVQFSDVSTGQVGSHVWDFGDGYGSTSSEPVHTFTEPGLYTITLTVTGTAGCPDMAFEQVRVYPAAHLYYLPVIYHDH